jgi:DNA mismatch repair protein MutS
MLAGAEQGLGEHGVLVERLGRALAAELPLFSRDGGFIAAGYAFELDQCRELRDDSRRAIAQLQARYAEASGVASLRIRHNNVIGYYVEVSAANVEKLGGKLGADFMHRQTMAGAMRYTTVELSELESKIASAAERALALELRLFEDLVGEVMARRQEIAAAAAALASLDLAAAHAECASDGGWIRPEIDTGTGFAIRGGRHPTVEAALAGAGAFVANDCVLGEDRIWLVTGPNMAGKSTFLRQNALIAILAQIGAFVPASAARIGVVDRLFSRVGAADDLARGRSTFMVEMVETAAILNQAGPRSFVILDEIGRGTATFDGLSIAWAALEHLHEVNRCRALFATHYHELTALAAKLPALACHTMRVKEWQGAPTASMSPSWLACRRRSRRAPKRCCRSSKRANRPARWRASPTICRCFAPPALCRPCRSQKHRWSRPPCARPAPTSSVRARR